MSRPLISFLTTAYGTERYVAQTIDSVLAQTCTDWELIVVDNGCSEEMAAIVGRYTDDARITLVRQPNKGFRGGVMAAARAAAGRYVCVLDSDDLVLPGFCEQVAALLAGDPVIEAVGCDAELFRDDGTPPESYFKSIGRRSVPDPSRPVSLAELVEDGTPLYLGVVKREVWDAHGGYDAASGNVEPDVALWLSLAAAGRDIRVLPGRLARIRIRTDSLSRDPASIEEFEHRLQQTFLDVCTRYPISEGAVSSGRMMRRLRYHQALRRARRALLDDDIQGARDSARDAYRHQRSVRAATLTVALRLSPRFLKSVHPVKNRAQRAMSLVRFRIRRGRVA